MAQQKLITASIMKKLVSNGQQTAKTGDGSAFKPVVKFFTPDAHAAWLITEIAEDGDTLFGLCDVGLGSPELGYVSLTEIKRLRGGLGLPVERDQWFKPTKTISEYADEARANGGISR